LSRLRGCHSAAFPSLAALALLAASGAATSAHAADLSNSLQQTIRAATFEVVQLKPPDGDVTYDRPLPLELIPYQQRTDKYRSIGTAFAIGPNRYVTAAHVISLGMGSQFGPPALRDTAGKVYEIDQVFKFSDARDFAVFSVREPPKGAKFLTSGAKPALNTTVYAVGNALGEGVIIRDGTYTSDTPEEVNGRWQWLRFSAAASPGNSGGPLVDEHGRVIGVVLRKSPSENLNVALPIAELLSAKDNEGTVGGRFPVRAIVIDASETVTTNDRFDLPKSLAQLYETDWSLSLQQMWGATIKLLEQNKDHLFPHGAGSERLLHTIERAGFLQPMREDPNKIWVTGPPHLETVQLDNNGFVEQSAGLVRLRAPDGVGLATLYGDDKFYLDLLLKAYMLRRVVGSDSVRVTSLGKPRSSSHFTDRWGRTWQVRDWAIPYDDQILSLVSLPTPDGYVATLSRIGSGYVEVAHRTTQLLCDYFYLTMQGNLGQWQDYLAQKGVQPKAFDSLKIDIDPEREVAFHSDHYDLKVKPELVKLSKESLLFLDFGYTGNGDAATWDVKRVVVTEGPHTNNWIHAARRLEPPASLPDAFQSNWTKLKTRSFPFNGQIESQSGQTRITAAVPPPGAGSEPHVLYSLEVTREGVQTQQSMAHRLELLEHAFTPLAEAK
jgi:serine protease Do